MAPSLQTYEWRGELGIFDRLSYRNLREIPRNWKMTTMDVVRIESKANKHSLPIQWHPENSVSGRLLGEESVKIMERISNEPGNSFSSTEIIPVPESPKRKR